MRLIFKTSSVTPDFVYVFNIILSFSTCSQSFKKICTWEILGANVLKCKGSANLVPRVSHERPWERGWGSTGQDNLFLIVHPKHLCKSQAFQGVREGMRASVTDTELGEAAISDFFTYYLFPLFVASICYHYTITASPKSPQEIKQTKLTATPLQNTRGIFRNLMKRRKHLYFSGVLNIWSVKHSFGFFIFFCQKIKRSLSMFCNLINR